jgi:cysteine synthase B
MSTRNLVRSAVPSPFDGATGVLAEVGNTPLIRLRESVAGLVPAAVEVWVKAEWFNPGGSVKDRPALAMVLDAERRGVLRPGATILDASSGNTGIAEAMVAAARGYRLLLCLPKNASPERKALLKAFGADIEPTSHLDGTDGAIRRARELAAADPGLVWLDQYSNEANWRAHFATTGPELWDATDGRITHLVAGVGTSGTLVGTGRYLKAQNTGIRVVEVQPDGPLHGLEGLKHMETAIIPGIYDPAVADARVAASTEDAYSWVRTLARREGLYVGPSSGAAVSAAVALAAGLARGVVVAILPDGGARYASDDRILGGA